jgi:hypothetical protein
MSSTSTTDVPNKSKETSVLLNKVQIKAEVELTEGNTNLKSLEINDVKGFTTCGCGHHKTDSFR